MGQKIVVQIRDKIATCLTDVPVVCGNSDYVVAFDFDAEWDKHRVKTARFKSNCKHEDVVFEDNECPMPPIFNAKIAWVGVFAGDLSTSTPAIVHCKPGILDGEDIPAPPRDDVYTQLVALTEEAIQTAESVEERANNGEFKGDSPVKGVDYFTEDDKTEIVNEVTEGVKPELDETLAGKLDVPTGVSHIWGTDQNGNLVYHTWSQSASGKSFVRRTPYGQVKTKEAIADDDSVNLRQMNEALENVLAGASADLEREVGVLTKKVANLEAGVAGDMFTVDDATAYVKSIPADAAPYAELRAVGGMVHAHEIPVINLYEESVLAEENGREYEVGDGGARINVSDGTVQITPLEYGYGHSFDYYKTQHTIGEIFPNAKAGKTYVFHYDTGEYGGAIHGMTLGSKFTMTEEILQSKMTCYVANIFDGFDDVAYAATYSNISLTEEGGGTRYLTEAKVTSLEIRNASGEVTHTFAIPEAVQALDGFGWGAESYWYGVRRYAVNSIGWDENGRPTFVKRVEKKVFDGTEYWRKSTTQAGVYFAFSIPDAYGQGATVCNKHPSESPDYKGIPAAYLASDFIVFPDNPPDTVNGWKAQLAEWYAKGDPLTVYYELAEPIVTDISHLITEDNLIPVDGGGVIIAQNENEESAPTTIMYPLRA